MMNWTDLPHGTELPCVVLYHDPDNPDVDDLVEQIAQAVPDRDMLMEIGRYLEETGRERIRARAASQVTPAVTPEHCPTCGQALPRQCEWCGGPMVGKRPEARTCSGRCRVAAHRAGR